MLTQQQKEAIIGEIAKKDGKFVLACSVHKRGYGSKKPPKFDCKECQMVQLVGLICNTPPEKRMETLEMLEYSTNKLIEADKRGEIDRAKLYRHPKITIEGEDGNVTKYNQ
jgi:hypothetical protein